MHVELSGLTKHYGSAPALEQINLQIPPGRIMAVIGLNGAGKTTLLRCLSGLVAPSKGQILYDREPFHRGRLDHRRRLLFMPDFPTVYGSMNVLQHVSLMFRLYERDAHAAEETVFRALTELDLLPLAEATLGQLSRGQLYKAALVALFTIAPELWLLDEPFASGLDPQGLAVLKQAARTHVSAGGTVVYSTQILEIAEKFSDELVVIDRGRLVAIYNRQQLAALPADGPESLEARLRQFRETTS